jgi:hypothetical protein
MLRNPSRFASLHLRVACSGPAAHENLRVFPGGRLYQAGEKKPTPLSSVSSQMMNFPERTYSAEGCMGSCIQIKLFCFLS